MGKKSCCKKTYTLIDSGLTCQISSLLLLDNPYSVRMNHSHYLIFKSLIHLGIFLIIHHLAKKNQNTDFFSFGFQQGIKLLPNTKLLF